MAPANLPDLELLRREHAEKSFAEFFRQCWPVIDPHPYLHNWHLDCVAEHLQAVTNGQIQRLLINIPPRSAKSLEACVAWPAWTWIQEPNPLRPLAGRGVRFLHSSYAQPLSTRDTVKCRRLLESKWYRKRWGDRVRPVSDQNTKTHFELEGGGVRLSTSTFGTLTGEGGDIFVIDDPHNVTEIESDAVMDSVYQWWSEAAPTRLNDPKNGAYVVIMQRLSDRDLAARIVDEGDWYHLCLPMRYDPKHPYVYAGDPRRRPGELLHPARTGERETTRMERVLGAFGTAGQLQQLPAPRTGGILKVEKFRLEEALPPKEQLVGTVRHWDLAATDEKDMKSSDPSFTAGVCVSRDRKGRYYVHHGIHFQKDHDIVKSFIVAQAGVDGKRIVVSLPQDPGQAGKAQVRDLVAALAGYVVRFQPETGSKVTRALPFASQLAASNVSLVVGSKESPLDWTFGFLEELRMFPGGRHSDWVDAVANAFNQLLVWKPIRIAAPGGSGVVSPYAA